MSAALDTAKLIALNKAVDIDRKTPKVAAEEFATANNAHRRHRRRVPGGKIDRRRGQLQREPDARRALQIALNAAGYKAKVQQIGNRELYEPALEKGEIQVVPEYAATLAEFLNQKVNGDDAPAASSPETRQDDDRADATWASKVGLTFGKASAAQDQNAFAVTKAFADKNGVKTLSRARGEVLRRGHRPRRPAGVPAAAEVPAGPGRGLQLQRRQVHARWTRAARRPRTRLKHRHDQRRPGVLLRRRAGRLG